MLQHSELPMSLSVLRRWNHVSSCAWFWAWAVVGCLGALSLISFALGPLAVVPAAIAGILLARNDSARRSVSGLLTGAGLLLLAVGWLQRAGPGTTCWQTANASGCDQHLNPFPWLVAGLALVAAGIAAEYRRQDRVGR
jgi:hypothetical protein